MTPRRVRSIALCGAGMISHAHAAAARHLGLPIVAVASRSQDRRNRRAADLSARAVDYMNLPAGADIVIIATPPAVHFDHCVHALERGAAVLVEKPFVTTLNQADRLVSIAQRHGHRLTYGENLAYAPAVGRWIAQIAAMDGLHHLSVRMEQGPPTWGDFGSPAWGGGVLFDLGAHAVALAVLTARAARAGEVVSVTTCLDGDDTDDHAIVSLAFTSGLVADLVISWRGPSTPHWSLQAASPTSALTVELMPDVIVELNGSDIPVRRPTTDPPMIDSLGFVDQLRAVVTDLDDATSPWMSAEFGRWVLEIVCACYVSAGRNAQPTPVPSGCDRLATPRQLWRPPNTVGEP